MIYVQNTSVDVTSCPFNHIVDDIKHHYNSSIISENIPEKLNTPQA